MAELDEDLRRLEAVEVPLAWEYFKSAETVPEYLTPLLNLPRRDARPSRAIKALLLGAGAALAVFSLQAWAPQQTPPPPELEPTVVVTAAAAPVAPTMTVMLAADPLDAHVFRGDEDLGQIPLLIQLRPGQVERLTLRRAGYKPRELVLDGSETRFAIPLEKLPGPTAAPNAPALAAPQPVPPTAESARVVDLRQRTASSVSPSEELGWSPNIEQVFDDEAPPLAEGALPAESSRPVILPPQYMDPDFAPEPPGPPASAEPAGPKPLPEAAGPTEQARPSGADRERSASSAQTSAAPPGPPPIDQQLDQ